MGSLAVRRCGKGKTADNPGLFSSEMVNSVSGTPRPGNKAGAFCTWPLKACTTCGVEKSPATDFRITPAGNSGATCKECRLALERDMQRRARKEGRKRSKCAHEMTPEQLERRRASNRRYAASKRTTPKGNIYNRMSRQIWQHIKGQKNRRSWVDLLPYTIDELVAHLEAQFVDGISWDNMGEWHIDHIRPVSSFNYESTDDPEFLECWALENLQPLWGPDNCRKGAKYES